MKNWKKLCLLIGMVMLYIISINVFANVLFSSNETFHSTKNISGADLEISVGDVLSVKVIRAPHWWGRMLEENGNSYLYLFELINLPIKIKNHNFIWFHLIFLVTLTLISVLMFTKKYKEVKKDEKLEENFINNRDSLICNDI